MSELALQLIAGNQHTQNPKLDLGNCGLTTLPEELFDCVWLEELILSNKWWDPKQKEWVDSYNKGPRNNLSALHKNITNLKQLKILKAGGNYNTKWKISDFDFLSSLTELQSLDLSFNQISKCSFLSSFKDLQFLNLSFNEVSDVSFLSSLTSLQSLDLSSNQISDFSFLSSLTGLQSLGLSLNRISDAGFLSSLTNLQSLNLSSSQISDISFLSSLMSLQSLDLSVNQISDFSFLSPLTGLQSLNLSFNGISDISFVSSLTGLQSLDLSSNQISDISFLSSFKGLQTLNLSSNEVSDISFLSSLTSLQSLNLSFNPISDISFLSSLTGLHSLGLSSNPISDISFLSSLTGLQSLDLSSNGISDISFMSSLTGIQSLDLNFNKVSDISFLSSLTGLQSLDLSANEVSDISILSSLKNLQFLSLNSNQISDFSFLSSLTSLESLNLNSNHISDFNFLSTLTRLQSLDLSSNLASDLSFLSSFKGLQSLSLNSNQISDISFLSSLTGLQYLSLRANQILDISFLSSLTGLQSLDLSVNPFSDLGLEFLENIKLEIATKDDYGFRTGKIFLWQNEIRNVPAEVLEQGRHAVIDYLQGELKPLNECKLIFTGEGSVGKTSLMRRITENSFDEAEKTTHGINKISWKELNNDKGEIIKVNLWDFGGQHIQHSLHQFFFSQRVIYVLVLNPRNDEKAHYWLEQIDKLGKGSEIIIVYNWKNEKDKQADYLQNFHELRKKYPTLPDPFLLSCKTNEGVTLFKEKLKELILQNDGLKTKYRKEWFNIKKKLEEKVDVETNYIEYQQYEQWCNQENYNDPDRRKDLLKILNSIGSIVYFDKPVLNKLQVLNPEWITTGAYAILTSELTKNNKGDISWDDLKQIFSDEKSVFSNKEIKIKYNEDHFLFIIELMLEYRLMQENPLKKYGYLIPSVFGDKPNKKDYEEIKTNSRNYRIQFNSPFEMLIMHRFIAKNIVNITGKDYWNSGIYMKHQASETFGLVETNLYSYRIDCWIKGNNIRGFWETIRSDFRDIFNMYYNFSFREEVLYEKDDKQVFLPYEEMLDSLKNGVNIIQYHPTYQLKNIDVHEVLDLFETRQQTQTFLEEKIVSSKEPEQNSIFFSYAWGEEREKIVDELYSSLKADKEYILIRDKKNLGYRELISGFMKKIGQGDCIVVVISDKYLRSEYCMFELYEIFRNSKFETDELQQKIFPIYVENISLNRPKLQQEYIKFWQEQEDDWNEVKSTSRNFTEKQNQQFLRIKRINAELGDLLMLLSDMNALTKEILSDNNFEIIKNAIKQRAKEL